MTTKSSIESRRNALRDRFPTWQPLSLGDWLHRCAAQYPTRPFVLSDTTAMTYRDVAEESRRLAAGLFALGVRPGDRVGILMANYAEFVKVKFAIARIGALAAPFNYLYRENELAFVLGDSGCRTLITMTEFGTLNYQDMLDSMLPGWNGPGFADRAGQMIFVLYGTRLASPGALLSYCISMAIYPWFHPGETTYVLFVTILYVGVFLSLQTIAYVRSENENELQQTLREVHDARRLAEALTEMTAILSSTLDLEEVLDRILQQIAGIVPSSSSDIMLIENGVARIVRLRGFQTRGIEQQVLDLRFPLSQFANLRQMIASGETILIEDTAAHPEWVPIPVVDWIRAELSAPIRLEGETIGFLNLSDERPGAFTPAQARLLTTFAVQAAIAIRNARLFDETRRYSTDLEKEVNERTAQLHLTHTRLRAILDTKGEGIFYTEGAYIQYANAAMAALTGYTQQVLIGKTLDSLRDPGLNTGELQQIRTMKARQFFSRLVCATTSQPGRTTLKMLV